MKSTILKFIIVNCIIIFSFSCNNNEKKIEDYKVKDGYKKHEFVFENKRISFIMPDYYSDIYIPKDVFKDDSKWYDMKKKFYSTENDNNSLTFVIFENYYDEFSIDTVVPHWIQESIYEKPARVRSCFEFFN
jgi:hypothetical protein